MGELTSWSRDLAVDIGGRDVINHAGAVALRLLADRTGAHRCTVAGLWPAVDSSRCTIGPGC